MQTGGSNAPPPQYPGQGRPTVDPARRRFMTHAMAGATHSISSSSLDGGVGGGVGGGSGRTSNASSLSRAGSRQGSQG